MKGILHAACRGRLALLAACAFAWGCGDEADPAYQASLLEDPVETEAAVEKLRKMIDERLATADEKAKASAGADYASRTTSALVAAFKGAEGNPLVQGRILSILTRSVPYTRDPGPVLEGVFFPILDQYKERLEDAAQASLVVDTISSLASGEGTAKLSEAQVAAAAQRFHAITMAIRTGWNCQERQVRMQGRESPVADQEQLILSCINGTAKLLNSENGAAALGEGTPILADAMRESVFFQDFFLNRAAADALNQVAEKLTPEYVQQAAPALVEGLFLEGDFFLYPYARRALIHIAGASDENREIVATELIRALNVDMPEDISAALPQLATIGRNENLALLAIPCGTRLSVSCGEERSKLERWVAAGSELGRAECNRNRDPDRPGSGFQFGFNYGVFWDKVGNLLVDMVVPLGPGTNPDPTTKTGLALEVLRLQVSGTRQWVDQTLAAKALLDGISGVYPEFEEEQARQAAQQAAAGGAASAPAEEAPAAPARPPTISNEVKPLFQAFETLRASEATKYNADARAAASALLAALANPEAEDDDKEASKELLKGFFSDVQNELLGLCDHAHDFEQMNLRLWRTVAASRALSMLSVSGTDDGVIQDLIKITQFALEEIMGFRITSLKAFPQILLRFKQRFTAEGMPMMGQPTVPAFIDAIQNYLRPTPQVMNFLLHMLAANALTGENQNATIREEKYIMINADVMTFRALATRAFFAIFRRDPILPDADRYLELFEFYTRDVQYVQTLEKADQTDPAFRMYPPTVPPAPDAPPPSDEEPDLDWLTTMPDRSPLFGWEAYHDKLAQCVLYERENAADVAKWRRQMNDEQKTQYCRKWVEPWASQFSREMAGVEIAKLGISDSRCWVFMKEQHDNRFQYCLDKENNRTPQVELNLTTEQCKDIKEYDDTYYYCVDLRFLPEYVESGKPTLWGCYDEFPWLRNREPIGPACTHISQRLMAAYLYVRFRSAANIPAPDGVTIDSLNAIMPIDQYLNFVKTFGTDQSVEMFQKADLLVRELAKVQLDFPVFSRPTSDSQREARTNVRKPDDVEAPMFVPLPWYWHTEWITREPRNFSDLSVAWLESCRAEGDETGTTCARDGGKLGNQMKVTIEGGAPGPLMDKAHSMALMLMREDLVTLGEMREALVSIENSCYQGGSYSMSCIAEAALAGSGREATLLVNPSCRGMAADALSCTPDPLWTPGSPEEREPCSIKKEDYAKTVCARFFTEAWQARGFTSVELNHRVRALYLLSAVASQDRALAEATVGDMLVAIDSDARFLPPVTFAIQKIRPQCCPINQEGACDKLGCMRVRAFSEYWRANAMHEGQAPDIDALYYMLLASR